MHTRASATATGQVGRWLPPVFVASGAAALMLEVTWSRLLTLQVGHTTGATSTVLAAFMGGLAVGSALGGWLAERSDRRQALVRYAALELGIAAAAIALPFVLSLATPVLEWAYADGQSPSRFGIARVIVSLLSLAVPTMAMGATYPLATRVSMLDEHRDTGSDTLTFAGRLYTANTIGAAVGALLAGFLLLPAVGIRVTTWCAAALNVLAGATAWWLALLGERPTAAGERATKTAAGAAHEARGSALVGGPASRGAARDAGASAGGATRPMSIGLVVAAVFGLVALVNQVVWTRVLALIVGPTTFAFSAMVGVFIGGLAVGAAIGTWLARRSQAHRASRGWLTSEMWLGVSAFALAVAMTVAMQVTGRVLLWIAGASEPTGAFEVIVWRQIGVAAILVGPLSLMCGAAFPLALAVVGRAAEGRGSASRAGAPVEVASLATGPKRARVAGSRSHRAGRHQTDRGVAGREELTPMRVSWTYAANTSGAIAGALLAGFVLIPAVGLQTTLRVSALAAVVVGVVVLMTASASWRGRAIALGMAAMVGGAVVTRARWDPALLSSGAYRFAPAVPPDALEAVLTAGDLLFYREGAASTVAVRRLGGTTSLVIDGKPDASNAADMLTQKLLAHLPLLLHPAPARVSILGLGSGVTAGAALTHPIARADVVEISPDVVAASSFFRAENRGVLTDPRLRLLVADGRSHLKLADARYDVVISEPSNPWMAGVASLYTREFMTGVRERLAPGGLFCQWTHTYDMAATDLQSIVATFLDVFPHASLWLVGESDVLLIGSPSAFAADAATIASRLARPGVAGDLQTVAVSSAADLVGLRVADTAALHAYAAGAPVQTDDRMALEFSAPRSLAARSGRDNVTALLALSTPPDSADLGAAYVGSVAHSARLAGFETAPVIDRSRAEASQRWASRGRMLLRADAPALAFEALSHAVALDAAGGDAGDSASPDVVFDQLVRAAGAAGKVDAAIAQLRELVADDARAGAHGGSSRDAARIALARLLMSKGDATGAVAAIAPAVGSARGAADAHAGPTDVGAVPFASAGPLSASSAIALAARGTSPCTRSPTVTSATTSSPPCAAAAGVPDRAPGVRALIELASIVTDLGDADRLAPIVARLQVDAPRATETRYFGAALAFLQGRLDDAVSHAQALVDAAPPGDARTHNLIGAALATQGRVTEARAAFARSIAADPRDADAYVNAGSLEIEHGDPDAARRLFATALVIHPTLEPARRGLATARAAASR